METEVPQSEFALYCRVEPGVWHRVLDQSGTGVTVDSRRLDFDTVWGDPRPGEVAPDGPRKFIRWEDLDIPLPRRDLRCWGFALTYPDHRGETVDDASFRFVKEAPPLPNSTTITYRNHLDYELEIGLLINRDSPGRFGYFLANDLTDRGMQIENYDPKDPAPGFGKAKSFEGALRAGPLLAVGDASLWPHLSATLKLNGEVRQTLNAADCNLDPAKLHEELFPQENGEPWMVVATGTTSGTLFRVPKAGEKLKAFVAAKFSMTRAKKIWLETLRFLVPGDELIIQSEILGRSKARLKE